MAKTIVTGEYQPHLEQELVQAVRRIKDKDPLAPLLIVVPTNLLALHLSRLMARELGGHAELHFLTLIDLAKRLGERPMALKGLCSLPAMADHLMLRETVREFQAKRSGSYFSRVAETEGFIGVFLAAVEDLKDGCLGPGDLMSAVDGAKLRPVAGDKIREVAALWSDYEDRKTSAGFYDRADLMAEAASNAGSNRWLSGLREVFVYGFYDLNLLQRRLVERCVSIKDTTFFFPYLDEPAFEYARPTLEWMQSLHLGRARGASKLKDSEAPQAGEIEGTPRNEFDAAGPSCVQGRGPSGVEGPPIGEGETGTPPGVNAQRHGVARPASLGDAQGIPAGLVNLRAGLFKGSTRTATEAHGVSILSVPGEFRESREICRELLRLVGLNGGAKSGGDISSDSEGFASPPLAGALRFNDVGILLRQPARYAAHFARVLDDIGVEPFLTEGLPLARSRAGRSLILLMELIESDLARRQVMDFLAFAEVDFEAFLGRKSVDAAETHRAEPGRKDPSGARHNTAPSHPEASTSLWDLLSKEAGVVKGLESWRSKLSILQSRARFPDESETREDWEESKVHLLRHRALATLMEFIERLALRLGSFPAKARPSKYVEETAALYAALTEKTAERERAIQALHELAHLDSCCSSLDRSSFFWLVRRRLESAQTTLGSFQGEGPTVAGLMAARGLPFKVVVLPGLTERWFPQAARQDPVLLDGERRALNRVFAMAGVEGRLALEADRIKEERLLFRLGLGAASRFALLTYPRIDPLTGGERIPSSFLIEAARVLTGTPCDTGSLDAHPLVTRIGLASLFPEDGAFIGGIEFDLSVAETAVARGDPAALAYLKASETFFADALRAEKRRWGETRFTPYDGVLENPESLSSLRGRYAGGRRAVAPTSLEDYAACPFVYLMRHIFGIEALEDPEEVLSISPRDRGGLAHAILERTYGEVFSEGEGPGPGWEGVLRRNAEKVLDYFSRRTAFGLPLLWDLEEQRLVADLISSVRLDLEGLGGFAPWGLELAYGIREGAGSGAPLQLPLGGGRRIALGGKMDRVDMDRAAGKAKVIDYKTGKGSGLKDNSLGGGRSLQLPLYVMGARHLLGRETEVTGAEYFFVSGAKQGSRVHFAAREVDTRMEDLATVLRTVVEGVEAGLFFAHPGDSCRYCEYAMACGQCRFLFERKRTDPRIAAFLRMREIE